MTTKLLRHAPIPLILLGILGGGWAAITPVDPVNAIPQGRGRASVLRTDPWGMVPASEPATPQQSGLATWYGLDGNVTACGTIYSRWDYTAASNTYPCGTVLTVMNDYTGDIVTVTVTDRGGFGYPIILDLSYAAFATIANPAQGVVSVTCW
jgi:rare lipoprotein A